LVVTLPIPPPRLSTVTNELVKIPPEKELLIDAVSPHAQIVGGAVIAGSDITGRDNAARQPVSGIV
jgi:hypothetical protein